MPQLKGEIIVPTTQPSAVGGLLAGIETRLAEQFDGYSRYTGSGGWMDDGSVIEESHVRLVATGEEDEIKRMFRVEAERVKRELDEDAVLVQFTPTTMELI